jgi:hypothetical protein
MRLNAAQVFAQIKSLRASLIIKQLCSDALIGGIYSLTNVLPIPWLLFAFQWL